MLSRLLFQEDGGAMLGALGALGALGFLSVASSSRDDLHVHGAELRRAEAFGHLLELAAAVPMKPALVGDLDVLTVADSCCGGLEALGVGQALHSFFWWGDRPEALTLEDLQWRLDPFPLYDCCG